VARPPWILIEGGLGHPQGLLWVANLSSWPPSFCHTYLLIIFFSSRFKFIIIFVSLHMGPTYSMVNLKKIYIEMVKRMKPNISRHAF
jgi:hypothetical protein